MSFLKLNLCESTIAAIGLFTMFRDGTVNCFLEGKQRKTYGDHGTGGAGVARLEPERFFRLRLYLTGDCNQVRVHDTHDLGRRRLVEFFVKNPLKGEKGTKVTFSVTVFKIEDPSQSLPKWTMLSAKVVISEPFKEKEVIHLDTTPLFVTGIIRHQFVQLMERYVPGDVICFKD